MSADPKPDPLFSEVGKATPQKSPVWRRLILASSSVEMLEKVANYILEELEKHEEASTKLNATPDKKDLFDDRRLIKDLFKLQLSGCVFGLEAETLQEATFLAYQQLLFRMVRNLEVYREAIRSLPGDVWPPMVRDPRVIYKQWIGLDPDLSIEDVKDEL